MGYKRMSESEKILEEFPGLSREDLDAVDALYKPYLFYKKYKYGREVWTTCCHQHVHISAWKELVTPEDYLLLAVQHGDEMQCPWCGRSVTVKNHKLLRSGWKHQVYVPVLFLHTSEDGSTVYAQGYWTMRDHRVDPQGITLYMVARVYRFRRGEVRVWERDRYGGGKVVPVESKGLRVSEPVQKNGLYSATEPYNVIGMNRLVGSFLRYTEYEKPLTEWERVNQNNGLRGDLVNYLAAAARWPESVEMLRKVGLEEPVIDLVYSGKKNADIMKWGETDPRKAFGLTKQPLKEFVERKGDMQLLRIWKGMRSAGSEVTWEHAGEIECKLSAKTFREVISRAKRYKIRAGRLVKYLDGHTGQRCYGGYVSLENAAVMWRDYIDNAAHLGYDLANPINQMPRDLERRHDETVAARKVQLLEEKAEAVRKRQAALDKRYAFGDECFLIRAPVDAEEIIAEGMALKHCVGGYAERHASGATTILFLRSKAAPDKPYVTIEMNGTEIRQIHGYKNDLVKGAVSPMVTHEKLLHDWRTWLKAGSKRDKQGNPVMPGDKKKKKEANVA